MNCPQSNPYIKATETWAGLEKAGIEAFEDVKASFQFSIEYGMLTTELKNIREKLPQGNLFIKNRMTAGGRFIEGNKRFYILSE